MRAKGKAGIKFSSALQAGSGMDEFVLTRGIWSMRCFRDGELIWEENWKNLITTAGLNYQIDTTLSAGTQITTWYIGLVNGSSPTFAAGDTMASHSGWTEQQSYDESTRVAFVDAGPSSGAVTNSASVAVFTISATVTVGGAFLVSNSTKGGTTGTLYAAGALSPTRSVIDNDVLQVSATFSVADDGV